jgi:hypothetical protein
MRVRELPGPVSRFMTLVLLGAPPISKSMAAAVRVRLGVVPMSGEATDRTTVSLPWASNRARVTSASSISSA